VETFILTTDEKTVMIMRAAGYSRAQIAKRLHCSVDRVDDISKIIHDKVRAIIGGENKVTAAMALTLAMISGEIYLVELLREFTSLHRS
jgi:plasmid maintenance system antidote protein VapI